MESKEERVVLLIADISGYTKFMLANETELVHSQEVITGLINTIIELAEIPLEVSKLEGDAVLFYAVKNRNGFSWEDNKKKIGDKLIKFFKVFSEKIVEMSGSNACHCGACMNIDKLRLKIIVHSGKALFYKIGNFYELAGADVIIAHRLLKNSVNSNQYILLTESAFDDIEFSKKIKVIEGEETYDEIGSIKTCVYIPSGD